jgi:hypothetical protein
MPSEIKAVSPLVDRLMRLIGGSHCVAGEEPAVELALEEALKNSSNAHPPQVEKSSVCKGRTKSPRDQASRLRNLS